MQLKEINKHVLFIRSDITRVFDLKLVPIPFAYAHFIYFISALYMPMFSYAMAHNSKYGGNISFEIVGVIAVLANTTFIVGMRTLASHMVSPFNTDVEDMDLITVLEATVTGCETLVFTKLPRARKNNSHPRSHERVHVHRTLTPVLQSNNTSEVEETESMLAPLDIV